MSAPQVRRAACAGKFYPSDPETLRRSVNELLDSADVEPANGAVRAVVVPHAGYAYSGATAAHSYRRAQGRKPRRIVLLGCSHYYRIRTASVFDCGQFETPLGRVDVDSDLGIALAERLQSESREPHREEHSLEVQLPFIQTAFGEISIVPILLGGLNKDWDRQVGELLAELLTEDDLVVVSTDLSHFLTEEDANEIDRHSIDTLLSEDIEAFADDIAAGKSAMCGATAVVAGMAYALSEGAKNWSLLDYRTSFRASGDPTRVVGYASVSMERAA